MSKSLLHLSICLFFITVLVLPGCGLLSADDDEDVDLRPVESCEAGDEPLYGSWRWVQSTGGIGGWTETPDSEGYTQRLCLDGDGTFRHLRDDSLRVKGTFAVVDTTWGGEAVRMIQYEAEDSTAYLPRQVIEHLGADSLMLRDTCFDCYASTYVRIE